MTPDPSHCFERRVKKANDVDVTADARASALHRNVKQHGYRGAKTPSAMF
jgi:hypothetical protein